MLADVLAVNPVSGRFAFFEVQPCACLERHQVLRPDNGYAFNKSNAGLQKGIVLLIKEDRGEAGNNPVKRDRCELQPRDGRQSFGPG
jgi:hypothetical protein